MRPPKYPLDPLARLRARRVDEATEELAKTVEAHDRATDARARAEAEAQAHEDEARRTRDAERAALDRGELSVRDLMRGDAWEHRVAAEKAELGARVDRAKTDERRAEDEEQSARAGVARKKADAEVVEKDRARFEDRVKRRADSKEEEAQTEAWRSPRRV
jgi:hypothetical protein